MFFCHSISCHLSRFVSLLIVADDLIYFHTIPRFSTLHTDAPSNRKLLSMMLKRAGFGIIDLVEDGQAAVDYCRALSEADQPRIIFMDNTMPRLVCVNACASYHVLVEVVMISTV